MGISDIGEANKWVSAYCASALRARQSAFGPPGEIDTSNLYDDDVLEAGEHLIRMAEKAGLPVGEFIVNTLGNDPSPRIIEEVADVMDGVAESLSQPQEADTETKAPPVLQASDGAHQPEGSASKLDTDGEALAKAGLRLDILECLIATAERYTDLENVYSDDEEADGSEVSVSWEQVYAFREELTDAMTDLYTNGPVNHPIPVAERNAPAGGLGRFGVAHSELFPNTEHSFVLVEEPAAMLDMTASKLDTPEEPAAPTNTMTGQLTDDQMTGVMDGSSIPMSLMMECPSNYYHHLRAVWMAMTPTGRWALVNEDNRNDVEAAFDALVQLEKRL
jgi:hypothetical protein